MRFLSRLADRLVGLAERCGDSAGLIVLLLLMLTPALAWSIVGALHQTDNDLLGWMDDRLPAKQTFLDFSRKFGRQDLLVVSWPDCRLDDPRLPALAASLSAGDDAACFVRITTTSGLFQQLTAPPVRLPSRRVVQSLSGNLLGPDQQTSCLIAELSGFGAEQRKRSVEAIRRAAEQVPDLDSGSLRLGGPAFELWALTDESIRSPVVLCGIAMLSISLVSFVLLRRWSTCLLVVGLAVFNGGLSVALVYVTGHGMNAVLMPMPTLIMVLSVSCSVHVVNYFRQAVGAGSGDVIRATLMAAWLPCVLSAATTAIGLAALITSDTGPVREFGLYSATSILVATAMILLIMPGILKRISEAPVSSPGRMNPTAVWHRLAVQINRLRWPIALTGSAMIAVCAVGFRWLDTSMTVSNTFAAGTRVIRDAEWLEEHVRPLSQLDLVVSFDDSNQQSGVQRLLMITQLAEVLRQHPQIGATLSLADFLPPPPTSRSIRSVARRAILNRLLENQPEVLRDSGYWSDINGGQSWRISMAVGSLSTTRYAPLLDAIKTLAVSTIQGRPDAGAVQVECTGAIALYDELQRQMLQDLLYTYATAFGAITLTMCLALASVPAGLVAMLPNVFPAVIVLGLLGWSGVSMDVGSIMTASVALGIAVDGTLHYVIAFRRSIAAGTSRAGGIEFAYARCGGALLQAAVICAAGIHILGYSDFLPTARFGWLIAAMLMLALAGDLVLLPALLAGPLGLLFARSRRRCGQGTSIASQPPAHSVSSTGGDGTGAS